MVDPPEGGKWYPEDPVVVATPGAEPEALHYCSGRPAVFDFVFVGDGAVVAWLVDSLFIAEVRRQPRCCHVAVP